MGFFRLELNQLFQTLAVALVGKVGAGPGDDMVDIVNRYLTVVVQYAPSFHL